jgi:anti-anti-sigma factor
MAIEIVENRLSGLLVIGLQGRLDSAGTPAFEQAMQRIVASGETRVVLDCTDLRYVSSVGLGVMIDSAKALKNGGGTLTFAGPNQHVRSVFEIVGFFSLFEIFSSKEEAMEALGAVPPPSA